MIVTRDIWQLFAEETDRSYYGGHGSRRLWVVFYQEEEMAKFTTRRKACDYIQVKENS